MPPSGPWRVLSADMEWALEDLPGVHDILEYECRLNYVLPKYDDIVVCAYDLRKFSAAVLRDIARVHPTVIVNGVLQSNPPLPASRRVPAGIAGQERPEFVNLFVV
jgi:hypothetical protein